MIDLQKTFDDYKIGNCFFLIAKYYVRNVGYKVPSSPL